VDILGNNQQPFKTKQILDAVFWIAPVLFCNITWLLIGNRFLKPILISSQSASCCGQKFISKRNSISVKDQSVEIFKLGSLLAQVEVLHVIYKVF